MVILLRVTGFQGLSLLSCQFLESFKLPLSSVFSGLNFYTRPMDHPMGRPMGGTMDRQWSSDPGPMHLPAQDSDHGKSEIR